MIFQLFDEKNVKNFNDYEDYDTIATSLRGTPLLYEDVRFVQDGTAHTVWLRPKKFCKNPYFVKGKPSRFDVLQGEEGDCWAVAAFQQLAKNIEVFERVVPRQGFGDDYVGAFHFRFFKLGVWYDVVVDDQLPVNITTMSLQKAGSRSKDVFWGALLEKAFAKFVSEYRYGYQYGFLDGGRLLTSFQSVTGGIAECLPLEGPRNHFWFQMWLYQSYYDGALIVASTEGGVQGNLMPGHAYPIVQSYIVNDDKSIYKGERLWKLMNPWGFEEWEGAWSDDDYKRWFEIDIKIRQDIGYTAMDDGEFWMSETDLFNNFHYLCFCHLSPANYARRLLYDDASWYDWYVTYQRGSWAKKRRTAGGSNKIFRHRNPQYVFTVGKIGEEEEKECPTAIELTIWNKTSRVDTMLIAYYIYDLSSTNDRPPFKQNFFFDNEPANGEPKFESSLSRCYVRAYRFDLGKKYLLVPCTFVENFEADFFIRIFSHYEVKIYSVFDDDDEVAKSLPIAFESGNKVEKEVEELFFKTSQGTNEVDWIGLREILNDVLGKSTDLISDSISHLFRFVLNMFLPITSYNEREDELLFSKDECRRMIAMLDEDRSGRLNFSEFSRLWNKICFWTKVYDRHKEDEYGFLPVGELKDALSAIGYDISTRIVDTLSYLYADEQGYLTLKDFIMCGVAMETVLPLFATKKKENDNIVVFTLQEWVKHTIVL